MATYVDASAEVYTLMRDAIGWYHPELNEYEVSVGVTLAYAPRDERTGEPKGPAIRDRGHPCCAAVKINSLADRVEGKSDLNLRLDGDHWEEWPRAKRLAVLDHALASVELIVDDDGVVQIDDANRPRLRRRAPDFLVLGYADVVSRHGEAATEVVALRAAQRSVDAWTRDARAMPLSEPEPVTIGG